MPLKEEGQLGVLAKDFNFALKSLKQEDYELWWVQDRPGLHSDITSKN